MHWKAPHTTKNSDETRFYERKTLRSQNRSRDNQRQKEIEKQNQLIYAKINGNFKNKYNIKRQMFGTLISARKASQT